MKVGRVALISFHTCPLAAPGQGKAGGMNVYVRELSRQLGKMGQEADVFTRYHGEDCKGTVELGDGVRLVHLEGGPSQGKLDGLYSHLPSFLRQVERFAQGESLQYRVVHSHYWLSGWVGSRLAEAWKVPHVVTFHTLTHVKMQARVGERESPVRSRVERELMTDAQLIIASSPQERESIARLYDVPAARVEVVPCGVDLSLFKPLDVEESRKKLGLNGEKLIVCVGRVEPIKGMELLLRTAAIMELQDPFKVLVVGGESTGEGEVVRLKGLARELGIQSVTEFVGMVDQRLLPLYYSAADVCVVPSSYESFGLVALEALACGTPVVASRVGGLPTVVQHGRTGYLLPWRCPEPFADSLEVILSSKGLRSTMSRAARRRAEGMGWEKVAQETSRLYRSVAEACR